MFKVSLALFPLVVSARVYAFPVSQSVAVKMYDIPLVVLAVSLFFLLVAIKLIYVKQRRIETIHSPASVRCSSNISSVRLRDKPETGNRHDGLLVGCLGSPAWETNLMVRLNGTNWRQSSLVQGETLSTMCPTRSASTRTKSTVTTGYSIDANLPLPSGHPWVSAAHGTCSSRSTDTVRRTMSTHCQLQGLGLPGDGVVKSTRKASPSSIRLVDGPSYSNQVEYAFLAGLPPAAVLVSPLMSTRDSFQLSRCSLRCNGKPVPPLPPLPSFLVLHTEKDEEDGYLPALRFSPVVSVAREVGSQQDLEEKSPNNRSPGSGNAMITCATLGPMSPKSEYDGGSPTSIIVQCTAPLRLIRQTNQFCSSLATVTDAAKCNTEEPTPQGNVKPLKSCLRQNPTVATRTNTLGYLD